LSGSKPSTRTERPYPPILVVVVVALLLLLAVAGFGSYRDLVAARQRQQVLQTRIDMTRARNEVLAEQIRRLQEDPAAIERLAREQYRMMRRGEVVVVLPEEPRQPRVRAAVAAP